MMEYLKISPKPEPKTLAKFIAVKKYIKMIKTLAKLKSVSKNILKKVCFLGCLCNKQCMQYIFLSTFAKMNCINS